MSKGKYFKFLSEERKSVRSGLSEGFVKTQRGRSSRLVRSTCLQATSSADTPTRWLAMSGLQPS